MTNPQQSWFDVFCGREAELATLQAAWDRVTAEPAKGPVLLVFLAESGLGKTRLVQEFYALLAARAAGPGGAGYWPERLHRRGVDLVLNPELSTCRADHPMSFLWWGLRARDPLRGRATPGDAVQSSLAMLRPHLEHVVRARTRAALDQQRMKLGRKVALDLAVQAVDAVALGLVGAARTAGERFTELLGNRREQDRLDEAIDTMEIANRERQSLLDSVVSDLLNVMSGKVAGGAGVPLVLVVDDAQFIEDDPTLRELSLRLVQCAAHERLPLLMIVTHWEREWHEAQARRYSVPSRLLRLGEGITQVRAMGRVADLGVMLQSAFSGLSDAQSCMLLDKADGNPRLLDEIIRRLAARPRYFEGRDLAACLTTEGAAEIKRDHFDLHRLVEERLGDAPQTIQNLVCIASVQGMKFVGSVALDAMAGLAEDAASGDPESLERAARPYAFVSAPLGDVAEFSQRVYYEVASTRLADLADPAQSRAAVVSGLHRLAARSDGFMALDRPLQQLARDIALTLLARPGNPPDDRALLAHCLSEAARLAVEEEDFHAIRGHARLCRQAIESTWITVDDATLPQLTSMARAARQGENVDDMRVLAGALGRAADFQPSLNAARCDAQRELVLVGARIDRRDVHRARFELWLGTAHALVAAGGETSVKFEAQLRLFTALLATGNHLREVGDLAGAESNWREALDVAYASLPGDRDGVREVVCELLLLLAAADSAQGRKAAAEAALQQALAAARANVERFGLRSDRRALAAVLRQFGKEFRDAAALREAVDIGRSLLAESPSPNTRRSLCLALADLAEQQADADAAGAIALYEDSLEIAQGLGRDPGGLRAGTVKAHLQRCLGVIHGRAARRDVAANWLQASIAGLREDLAEAAEDASSATEEERAYAQLQLMSCLVLLAEHEAALGLAAEAQRNLEDVVRLARELRPSPHAESCRSLAITAQLRLHAARVPREAALVRSPDPHGLGFADGEGQPLQGVALDRMLVDVADLLGPKPDALALTSCSYAVPFYPGWTLVRTDARVAAAGVTLRSFSLHAPGLVVPLAGRGEHILLVSSLAPIHLDEHTVIPYLRFYCRFVTSDARPFLIFERPSDLGVPVDGPLAAESSAPVVVEAPTTADEAWIVDAGLAHGLVAARARLRVGATGIVEMTDDRHLGVLPYRPTDVRTRPWNLFTGWPDPARDFEEPGVVRESLQQYADRHVGYGRFTQALTMEDFLDRLRAMAASGDATASWLLGMAHLRGMGTSRNEAAALAALGRAAEAGEVRAMSALAFVRSCGSIGIYTPAESRDWLERARAAGGEFSAFDNPERLLWIWMGLHREFGLSLRTPVEALLALADAASTLTQTDRRAASPFGPRVPQGAAAMANWPARLTWSGTGWVCDADTARAMNGRLAVFPHERFDRFRSVALHLTGISGLATPVVLADLVVLSSMYLSDCEIDDLDTLAAGNDQVALREALARLKASGAVDSGDVTAAAGT